MQVFQEFLVHVVNLALCMLALALRLHLGLRHVRHVLAEMRGMFRVMEKMVIHMVWMMMLMLVVDVGRKSYRRWRVCASESS